MIFGITVTPAAAVFPVLIALLAWVRLVLMKACFSQEELDSIDPLVFKE
jgi:hypothetical protein